MKAFIGHGGIASIFEAIHCGVPMIVVPQFGDQHLNGALVEQRGFGVSMQMSEVTEDNLSRNLDKILTDA